MDPTTLTIIEESLRERLERERQVLFNELAGMNSGDSHFSLWYVDKYDRVPVRNRPPHEIAVQHYVDVLSARIKKITGLQNAIQDLRPKETPLEPGMCNLQP